MCEGIPPHYKKAMDETSYDIGRLSDDLWSVMTEISDGKYITIRSPNGLFIHLSKEKPSTWEG